jgi:hypothetical protein
MHGVPFHQAHGIGSPWLMPLEAVFGSVKHRVLGARSFATLAELRVAVEQAFHARFQGKKRRDCRWTRALALPERSVSVSRNSTCKNAPV